MKKKLLCLVLVLIFLLTYSTSAFAANNINVNINGRNLIFDNPPVMQNGTTLVPMRTIFEVLGATVIWDGNARIVTASKDDTTVSLKIDSINCTKNGQAITLSSPAKVINGSTMVPLRFVSESFSCDVTWINDQHTVYITADNIASSSIALGKSYYENVQVPMLENLYPDYKYTANLKLDGGFGYYYEIDKSEIPAVDVKYQKFLEDNGYKYFGVISVSGADITYFYNEYTNTMAGTFSITQDNTDYFVVVIVYPAL